MTVSVFVSKPSGMPGAIHSQFYPADGSVNNLFSYMLGADGTKRRLVYLAGQSDKYWERYIVLTYCDHFLLNKLKSLR